MLGIQPLNRRLSFFGNLKAQLPMSCALSNQEISIPVKNRQGFQLIQNSFLKSFKNSALIETFLITHLKNLFHSRIVASLATQRWAPCWLLQTSIFARTVGDAAKMHWLFMLLDYFWNIFTFKDYGLNYRLFGKLLTVSAKFNHWQLVNIIDSAGHPASCGRCIRSLTTLFVCFSGWWAGLDPKPLCLFDWDDFLPFNSQRKLLMINLGK